MMKKTNCIQKITNRKERASAPALYPKKASASCLFIHRTRALFTASLLLTAMLALPQCADTKGFLTDDDEDITSLTSPIYLWTTAPNYRGDLGGVSGADGICNEPAEISAAMLPSGRSYMHRAIIVDDTSELPENFTIPNKGGREVQRPKGPKAQRHEDR